MCHETCVKGFLNKRLKEIIEVQKKKKKDIQAVNKGFKEGEDQEAVWWYMGLEKVYDRKGSMGYSED